jgi:hypothetical protein
MDLQTYSRQDGKYRYSQKSTIRVSTTGVFILNKKSVIKLGLKNGDKILIKHDNQRPGDWYIKKSSDEFAFVLRASGDHSLAFNAATIARKLLESINLKKSTTFRLSTTPTDGKYYAILTHMVKKETL